MCDAGREHAIFAEPRVDYPGIFRDAVAPVVRVVVVSPLAAPWFLIVRVGIADRERSAVGRTFVVVGAGIAL